MAHHWSPVTPESIAAAKAAVQAEREECERVTGVHIGEDGFVVRLTCYEQVAYTLCSRREDDDEQILVVAARGGRGVLPVRYRRTGGGRVSGQFPAFGAAMTHYIPFFTVTRQGLQLSACEQWVTPKQHSAEPTCAICAAFLIAETKDYEETAEALEQEFPEWRGRLNVEKTPRG